MDVTSPRERKSFSLAENEVKADTEKSRVEGYWASFGNRDHGGDVIHPGFFSESLAERLPRKGGIKVARNHQVLIGKPLELKEDDRGLWGVLEIVPTDGDLGGKNTLQLIQAGVLTHGSITYSLRGPKGVSYEIETDEDGTTTRHLLKGNLFELGPVDFAMSDEAEILGLKALDGPVWDFLRDLPEFTHVLASVREETLTTERRKALDSLAERLETGASTLRKILDNSCDARAAHDLLQLLQARGEIYGKPSEGGQ